MARNRFATQNEENTEVTTDTVNDETVAVDNTDTGETIPAADGTATTPARTVDPDRGNIGEVAVEDADDDDWTGTTGNNSPIAVAVATAEKGKVRKVIVDDDAKKIERVKRMLRAAATKNGVGMNIHPQTSPVTNKETGDVIPGRVYVKFKTADRLVRPAKPTEGNTDAPAETPAE